MTPILKDCHGNWIPNMENMKYLAKINAEMLEALRAILDHPRDDTSPEVAHWAIRKICESAIANAKHK